jgi:beta-lactamase regulating signal transducer with metallopeptidase domain
MSLFTDTFIKAICWTLLHSLWQGLLLALLTGLVMILSKRSSSAIRYHLLSGIFILFMAITCFTFYAQWKLASGAGQQLTTLHTVVSGATNGWSKTVDANTPSGISFTHYASRFLDYFNRHASLVVTIWFIVFMAKLVRILSGLVEIQRIKHYRTSSAPAFWRERIGALAKKIRLSREIRLLESAIIKVPMVVGFLKPTILVPIGLFTNLSPAEVESILLHELAHIRRRDYFFNLLQCFIDVAFFFNPAILWISSLIRNERENCCDDIAIRESKNKKQFVQALVSFHQYNMEGMKYAMPFAGRKSSLINRVRRIANNNNNTLNHSEKAVLLICMVVFSVAFTTIRQERTVNIKSAPNYIVKHNDIQKPYTSVIEKTIHLNPVRNPSKPGVSVVRHELQLDTTISIPVIVDAKVSNIVKLKISSIENLALEVNAKEVVKSTLRELQMELTKSIKDAVSSGNSSNGSGLEEWMQNLRDLGYKNVSIQQARILQDHGVNADFIISFREKGYGLISLDQALSLKDHGISVEFINSFSALGYKDIPLALATALEDHGVSESFIRSMQTLGYKNISLNQAIHLQDAGVRPEFIRSMAALGYSDIPLEQVADLKNHDVNADFIRGFQELGFKNISLEQATTLRDHDVTKDFILKMRKKTGSDFSLAEYITLKDQL